MKATNVTDKSLLVSGLKVLGYTFDGSIKVYRTKIPVSGIFHLDADKQVVIDELLVDMDNGIVLTLTECEIDYEELAECVQLCLPDDY